MAKLNRTAEIVCIEWLNAKSDEKKANQRRLELEQELIEMLGMKCEGSKTHNLEGFKVTIKGSMNRKLDKDAYLGLASRIPADRNPVRVVEKFELDDAGCRWLTENDPTVWGILAAAITTTPAKPSVTVVREG